MLPLTILTLLTITAHALPTATDVSTIPTTPDPLPWLHTATYTVLVYDVLLIAAFVWAWVSGYFWWMGRSAQEVNGGSEGVELREMTRVERERRERIEVEMRRMGMF